MAQFMTEHSNLAKNLLPNCGQGKVVANRLWETLTVRLNSVGPPTKNSKAWRKVYTDQKFNVKKKVSFNKASKKKTGGGPYQEIPLSSAEEQILQAAGIDVAVEGLCAVKSFGAAKSNDEPFPDEDQYFTDYILESEDSSENEEQVNGVKVASPVHSTKTKAATKLELLKSNIEKVEEYQKNKASKLDTLIELKKRSLKIKEEEHATNMKVKKIDLEIKSIELEILKKQSNM